MSRTLSSDVKMLGRLLGDTIRARGGEELFAVVERMRRAARAARAAPDERLRRDARDALAETAASLDAATAAGVVRAFTEYFGLVNLAEDVERIRVNRRRARRGERHVPESFATVLARLRRDGATREETLAALRDLRLRFVFTSHPTEARRRTTERILASVRAGLARLDRERLTPGERAAVGRRIRADVEALWDHEDRRPDAPTVLDEVKEGLWYLRHVLLDGVPRVMRRLRRAFRREFGSIDALDLPMPFTFGSWMGADRDGNPNVTDETTAKTLGFHRHIVLTRWLADLDGLVDPLAASATRLPATPALRAALARAEKALPDLAEEYRRRNPEEPLRHLLSFLRERVERARRFAPGAYADADGFLDDLRAIRETLLAANARALADDRLLDLIERVRCFRFVLAPVDVREDSRVHRRVVGELLGDPDYPERPSAERIAALDGLALPPPERELSGEATRLLSLFARIRDLRERYGADAIAAYCISMTESAADLLEIHRLLTLNGIEDGLDVVPLVETAAGLDGAGDLLATALADPGYRDRVRRDGDRQELLVGYSDSMKEGGILASRAGVLGAQLAAAKACGDAGVVLRVFHGRGGSVSRGGGPTHRAILALPRRAFSGDMKITEQGETRAFHFGDPDLAVRYVERAVGAALSVRREARQADRPWIDTVPETLAVLARESRAAYRALVDADGFLDYFREATPLATVTAMKIGSRPARRGGGGSLDTLRAIPWVFAWSQSRHVLTGWYGVGSALAAVAATEGGGERIAALHRDSPFFRDFLDNVQMGLAKSDLGIAERYASLVANGALRDRIFGAIREEYDRTAAAVLRIRNEWELLEDDPVLRRSIRLRNPYVDPLSWLQVEALRRLRAGEKAWEEVARSAVNGIAAGLRNTG